jgi:intron-binding protein aquarius
MNHTTNSSTPQSKGSLREENGTVSPVPERVAVLPPPKIPVGPKPAFLTPTVVEIIADPLTQLSLEYWAPNSPKQLKPFDPQVIETIYNQELAGKSFNVSRIMLLELSRYLEHYLWPNWSPEKSTHAYLFSIILMVNEKFRENVSAWDCFLEDRPERFSKFFKEVLSIYKRGKLSIREKTIYLTFLINCFQSLETKLIRDECLKLVRPSLWQLLDEGRLQEEIRGASARLQRELLKLKDGKAKGGSISRKFLLSLIHDYFRTLDALPTDPHAEVDSQIIQYCERFMELMIDLINQLPTRRFFHAVLDYYHVVVRSKLSSLYSHPQGAMFKQLVSILRFYDGFEIDNFSGNALTDEEIRKLHYKKMQRLQSVAWKLFPQQLRKFALSNVAAIDNRVELKRHLSVLSDEELRQLCQHLNLLGPRNSTGRESREFLLELIISKHERRLSQVEAINERSVYPDEMILWDDSVIPDINFTGERVLSLPKLNLQFLTFYDYLLRNYTLYRLESTYEIRQDIEDVVKRMAPRQQHDGVTEFRGWARMALPIKSFKLTAIHKPHLGETKPSLVVAEVSYVLPTRNLDIREEWEAIHEHDVLFLITIRSPIREGEVPDTTRPFPEQYGVKYIRGCEVHQVMDEEGTIINEWERERQRKGNVRTLRVYLDAAQYQADVAAMQKLQQERKEKGDKSPVEDIYTTFNLIMRRKPKENNFKAVLETIRDLMNTKPVVPKWLKDVFLGYGDPTRVRSTETLRTIDFFDTFLSLDHLKASFPNKQVKVNTDDPSKCVPPFKVTFLDDNTLLVEPYVIPNPGPYPIDQPKKNAIPFTPKQVEAICLAMNEGLTMVVGPPGTGKTDVAVQIISNWYHNFPGQRTLIVTHSNQALNQIFEKIMHLDIDERHLLRLGHGQELLETEKDFSKWGRVNYMLELRLKLLEEAARLAKSLGLSEDLAYTCETCEHFFLLHIVSRWEKFLSEIAVDKSKEAVKKYFPFHGFFSNAPQPLFKEQSFEEDMEVAEGCFRHLRKMFAQIQDCRAFELLKLHSDRSNYLLTKQATIVALTCTHAALKRRELVELGFKFDNILIEEAAQILEVETFIPLLLQAQDCEAEPRLKRIVLIGDHNQLPPVVKNLAFQKFGHLDQSLFTRFVRLNVPYILLDAQGRSRPSLAKLFSWRYKELGNLPHVLREEEYHLANAGFLYDYQFINVDDYMGRGEMEPNPHFIQNLGEAEFVVAVFMYMRLLGYPAEKITIITSYNGQKHLIRDVIRQRCASNPIFGVPHKVTTVDRFQGQQNDYILCSLVRTKTVGHIRDVRRLVVAMSRARLGLYIFGRKELFEQCYELTPVFSLLLKRPTKLMLVKDERYPTTRKLDEQVPEEKIFVVEDVIHMGQIVAPLPVPPS